MSPARPFIFPANLSSAQELSYTLTVIGKYQAENSYLRHLVAIRTRSRDKAKKDVLYWKQKYKEEKAKYEKLKKDNDRLIAEVEKILKTNHRYQVALFDHGNFKDSTCLEKKTKGGQLGHKDTNREAREDRRSFSSIRLFAASCQKCGTTLSRVAATRDKLLVDITLHPEVTKLLIQTERQWCPKCHREVSSTYSQSLPFTEYGLNTFLAVLILRFGANLSLAKVCLVLRFAFGLTLSKSAVAALLLSAKNYLKDRYESLKEAARSREITYHDETGWLVAGRSAWLWVMTTSEGETLYVAAESRGKGIAKENYGNSSSLAMHDGLGSYKEPIPAEKQLYCWAHLLRFAHEETVNARKTSPAVKLREKLVELYQLPKTHPEYSPEKLRQELDQDFSKILAQTSLDSSFQNICNRIKDQKDGLIRALLLTPDGTNNLAERELRPLVISKQTSFGSDTFKGMETTAILASIYRTTVRQEKEPLNKLKNYLLAGVAQTYPHYSQAVIFNSS